MPAQSFVKYSPNDGPHVGIVEMIFFFLGRWRGLRLNEFAPNWWYNALEGCVQLLFDSGVHRPSIVCVLMVCQARKLSN